MCFPLSDNGHQVHLWGTWLDDELLEGAKRGRHPRLDRPLPEGVRLFHAPELARAIRDADIILVAVTSEGFLPVFEKLLNTADHLPPVLGLTKGFVESGERVLTVSEGAELAFGSRWPEGKLRWVSVGGPVKAVELAELIPTAAVFGFQGSCEALDMKSMVNAFLRPYYRVFPLSDMRGVELSSALKNIYAMGMGICDGLYEGLGIRYYHNFKALLYNQAIREMALLVSTVGGRRETVFDLAGIGDLFVTSASGRNGIFGRRVGLGGTPQQEYDHMLKAGEVAEGYHTLALAHRYIGQRHGGLIGQLPMFRAIYDVLYGGASPREALLRFAEMHGQRQ
jgi:glycerol-3-phosphate dehydrogenase (NAD(P)+)